MRSTTLARAVAVALALGMLMAACSSTADSAVSTTTQPPFTTAPATTTTSTTAPPATTSEPPSDSPTVGMLSAWDGQQATLTVPLDHSDPYGPTVSVPIRRSEALDPDERLGVLLVNPGGPGFPAWPLVANASVVFTPDLRAHFDIVSIDPRGTFADTEVDCFDDVAGYWSSVDWSPDAPGELEAVEAAVQGWVDDCAAANGDLLPHVSTMDTVHDMALLVEALGEEQVSYLGFSYGTSLGAAFVSAYPELVRAAVLDAAYHPVSDPLDSLLDSYEGIDNLLVRVFSECDSDPECPITNGAQAAFERVAAAADAEPFVGNRFLPTVNEQGFVGIIRFSEAAYGGSADRLLKAVADADAGDPFLLQDLLSESAALLEAGGSAVAISCMDYPYRDRTPFPDDALILLEAVAPVLTAVFSVPEGFDPFAVPDECSLWPAGPDLFPSPLSGEGSGPILVVTATDDPVTPTASAERLAVELANGTLLLVDSNVHGSYQAIATGGSEARACATEIMDRFLIDLDVPANGMTC